MFKNVFAKVFLFVSVILVVSASPGFSQSAGRVWQEVDDSAFKERPVERFAVSGAYKTFRLNKQALKTILENAPLEFDSFGESPGVILEMPMPDGSFERFTIKESPIMEPELAAKFPEFKTYIGQGIENPTATTRFDLMPTGFHSIILSDQGTIYINPYSKSDIENYISFNKASLRQNPTPFVCETEMMRAPIDFSTSDLKIYNDIPSIVTNGTTLRQYRLALAATGEYTVAAGGTVPLAMARQVTTMNRVNGVYERELAVRMNIIANNDLIIYTDGATDPYTNNSGSAMLGENTTNLNAVIGSANYDIGHVFSTGGGGVATLNSPCGANKARGVTGLPNPTGDVFDIDFVSHEMGHQWGGSHTFNGSSGNCSGGNRSASNAFEPSSGSTIQAYAGICTPQNLQLNSNDYFHVRSLEQMVTFISGGGSCSADTANGNTPPAISVAGGTTFNIPANTPFELTAVGSDINGDTVTYNWEEYDLGPADAVGQPPSGSADAPVFRSYPATTSPSRMFPSIQYVLNNDNLPPSTYNCGGPTCVTGEVLPTISRSMTFQVTARDNRAGGGGINSTTANVVVDAGSGPFKVTAQDSLLAPNWQANTMQTVTWNVANTNAAPVSAANVMISLSTDGGLTFPTVILASTPNDGSEQIIVPNMPTTMARLKVQPVGNIFFDISNVNFTITAPTAAGASVSGRVLSASGRAIKGSVLTLLNTQTNEFRSVFSNQFGYYRFDDVAVGNFYILTINDRKGFNFPNNQQSFTLNDNLTGINFLGNPR